MNVNEPRGEVPPRPAVFVVLGFVLVSLVLRLGAGVAAYADEDLDSQLVLVGGLLAALTGLIALVKGVDRRRRFIYELTADALDLAADAPGAPETARILRAAEATLAATGAYREASVVGEARRRAKRTSGKQA